MLFLLLSGMKYSVNSRYICIFLIFVAPLAVLAEKEVFVDLSLQKAYAIENGVTLFEGRISSGKSGHETPTGSFRILQKERMHLSNLYPEPNGGAKMPYMMRLTWDGVAMHQGYVPNHPASHGCIRLRRKFAKKLFTWADKGTQVIVGGDISRYDRGGDSPSPYTKDRDGYAIIEVY